MAYPFHPTLFSPSSFSSMDIIQYILYSNNIMHIVTSLFFLVPWDEHFFDAFRKAQKKFRVFKQFPTINNLQLDVVQNCVILKIFGVLFLSSSPQFSELHKRANFFLQRPSIFIFFHYSRFTPFRAWHSDGLTRSMVNSSLRMQWNALNVP